MTLLSSVSASVSLTEAGNENVEIESKFDENMQLADSLEAFFDQFDHPSADEDYWGHQVTEEDVLEVNEEIDELGDSPEKHFEDISLEDMMWGYEEGYGMYENLDEEQIQTLYPEEAADILEMRALKEEVTIENRRQLEGKAIRYNPNKPEDKLCQMTVEVTDFAQLQLAVNNVDVDCIKLVTGTTYTWTDDTTLEISANRHLSIFAEEPVVSYSTYTQMKQVVKDKIAGKDLMRATLQGSQAPSAPPMFKINGGQLSVKGVIVRRGAGFDPTDGAQRGGFIYCTMGSVKLINSNFFFFPNANTLPPFSIREAVDRALDYKTLKPQLEQYNRDYLANFDAKTATPYVDAGFINGGNVYIKTGTLSVLKCSFSVYTAEAITAVPTNGAAAAQNAVLLASVKVLGGFMYVGKGKCITKLTKFDEFIPLSQLVVTKQVTMFKLFGFLQAVTTGIMNKSLFSVFLNQIGFPTQLLTGAGLLYFVGSGTGIFTGGSIIYNAFSPVWIGVGGAMFVGAGNLVVTGVFFNFNEVLSTFIGYGNLLFNGAGTLILTGGPTLANRGTELTIGGGTVAFLGAGVNINTGVPTEVFTGASYRLCAGYGFFQGSGHWLLVGSPVNFFSGALAVRGTGEYAFNGAGGVSVVGSPLISGSGAKWAFGFGLFGGLGAGKFMLAGTPVIEFAGSKGCFGVGCIVGNGAGIYLLEGVAVDLFHGYDFSFGKGQVVFLGYGGAYNKGVQVGQFYGYQSVNEDNPGVFVGNEIIDEKIEAFKAAKLRKKYLGLSGTEIEANGFVWGGDASISMASEEQVGLDISVEGDCRVCGVDAVAGENSCAVETICDTAEETVVPEEIILFNGELTVSCTVSKVVPEYPAKPAEDAAKEEVEAWRTEKSVYKESMRQNAFGCVNPFALDALLVDSGINAGLLSVTKKTTSNDVNVAECGTTEVYQVVLQSNDYVEAKSMEAAFELLQLEIDSIQEAAVIDEQSMICSSTISPVDMNVVKAPAPEIDVTGVLERGEEIEIVWDFLHDEGLTKAEVELVKLREEEIGIFGKNSWDISTRAASDTIKLVKDGEISGQTTYKLAEDLPGGNYVIRVTGSSKIGTKVTGDSQIFELGFGEKAVHFQQSVALGEKVFIPFTGFNDNVKVTLQQVDPATETMEKIAVIKKSYNGSKGTVKPVKWTVPTNLDTGDNYVVAISAKAKKAGAEPIVVLSKPFSITV